MLILTVLRITIIPHGVQVEDERGGVIASVDGASTPNLFLINARKLSYPKPLQNLDYIGFNPSLVG